MFQKKSFNRWVFREKVSSKMFTYYFKILQTLSTCVSVCVCEWSEMDRHVTNNRCILRNAVRGGCTQHLGTLGDLIWVSLNWFLKTDGGVGKVFKVKNLFGSHIHSENLQIVWDEWTWGRGMWCQRTKPESWARAFMKDVLHSDMECFVSRSRGDIYSLLVEYVIIILKVSWNHSTSLVKVVN